MMEIMVSVCSTSPYLSREVNQKYYARLYTARQPTDNGYVAQRGTSTKCEAYKSKNLHYMKWRNHHDQTKRKAEGVWLCMVQPQIYQQ